MKDFKLSIVLIIYLFFIFIVKSDLRHRRTVQTEEAVNFAQTNNLAFIETSALDATGVEEVTRRLIASIFFFL